MTRIVVVLIAAGLGTSWADTSPKPAAIVDRLVAALEADVARMSPTKGDCARLAAAIRKNLDADKKLFADMVAYVDANGDAEVQKYGKAKAAKFKELSTQALASTVGCRTNKGVVAAWEANTLLNQSFTASLPDEPRPEPVKPADYDAKTKKLDAALKQYRDVAAKIAALTNCTEAAKLVPRFRTARDNLFAANDALDKETRDYTNKDKTKSDLDAAMAWIGAHKRCETNKPFAAAVTRAGLDSDKD